MLTYLLSSTVSEFSHSKCQKSLYITTPLRLNPLTEGFPCDDLRTIFCGCQWMDKVSYGEKQDQKAPRPIALLNDSFGNRRFLTVCVTLNANFRYKQPYRVFVPPSGGLKGNAEALWADIGRNCAVWKLIYDFLLVINANLPPISHRFGVLAFQMSEIAIALWNDSFGNRRFLKGCVTLNANFR